MKLQNLFEAKAKKYNYKEVPVSLGKKLEYGIWDIFDKKAFTQHDNNKPPRIKNDWGGTLHFDFKDILPAGVDGPGIYAWSHPVFGYFYVGISAVNSSKRWKTHVAKLVDHCAIGTGPFPIKWQEFIQKFANSGYSIEDLNDVRIRFYPIPRPVIDGLTTHEFRKYLEAIETHIVSKLNTACNKEYDLSKPSATKFPTVGKIYVDLEDNN
jgi:hypothetical protein